MFIYVDGYSLNTKYITCLEAMENGTRIFVASNAHPEQDTFTIGISISQLMEILNRG